MNTVKITQKDKSKLSFITENLISKDEAVILQYLINAEWKVVKKSIEENRKTKHVPISDSLNEYTHNYEISDTNKNRLKWISEQIGCEEAQALSFIIENYYKIAHAPREKSMDINKTLKEDLDD